MKIEQATWLHQHYEFSLEELCELSGLSEAELRELVDHGVLAPIDSDARHWTFSADRLVVARSAFPLRRDFALDPHGVPLAPPRLHPDPPLRTHLRALPPTRPPTH